MITTKSVTHRMIARVEKREVWRLGTIPGSLLGRLGSWAGGALPRHDLEIALLRLAPGAGDSFWTGV